MNSRKLFELKEMVKYYGYVTINILEDGQLNPDIKIEGTFEQVRAEVETYIHINGAENVFF